MSKPFGALDKVKGNKKGLKPKDRTMTDISADKQVTSNQWSNSPKQNLCMELWTDPKSTSFGNIYASALAAGYAPSYAVQIAAPSIGNKWIQEYVNQANYTDNHIKQLLQGLSNDPEQYRDSKSPADTRIKALELLSKLLGLTDTKHQLTQINVTPILGGITSDNVTVEVES